MTRCTNQHRGQDRGQHGHSDQFAATWPHTQQTVKLCVLTPVHHGSITFSLCIKKFQKLFLQLSLPTVLLYCRLYSVVLCINIQSCLGKITFSCHQTAAAVYPAHNISLTLTLTQTQCCDCLNPTIKNFNYILCCTARACIFVEKLCMLTYLQLVNFFLVI